MLGGLGILASSPLLRAQQDPFRDHSRVPGLDELVNIWDFEAVFHAKVSREVYDYTSYGSESEFTLRRNREAFSWVELVSKGVADVPSIQTATEVCGTKMAFPIMLSPTSGHGSLHRDGELATHQGATAASNTPYIVSNGSSFSIDKIAAAATGPLWFQLYAEENLDDTREILEKAQAAGCKAVAITMDQQAAFMSVRCTIAISPKIHPVREPAVPLPETPRAIHIGFLTGGCGTPGSSSTKSVRL